MYNLLVSADENEWNGDPFVIERTRCVSRREYTDAVIADRFSELNREQFQELCSLPCMFAYEDCCEKNPKFGVLSGVKRRSGGKELQLEYKLIPCGPFATADDLQSLGVRLDIRKWELNRTHWAVKDVDLAVELARRGIELPGWARTSSRNRVDITRHRFDVALSFPGEHRCYIGRVIVIVAYVCPMRTAKWTRSEPIRSEPT